MVARADPCPFERLHPESGLFERMLQNFTPKFCNSLSSLLLSPFITTTTCNNFGPPLHFPLTPFTFYMALLIHSSIYQQPIQTFKENKYKSKINKSSLTSIILTHSQAIFILASLSFFDKNPLFFAWLVTTSLQESSKFFNNGGCT